jgi:hypothetical protein
MPSFTQMSLGMKQDMTLTNRRRAWRILSRRQKTVFVAQLSFGMSLDMTLEKTPSVATPPQDAIFGTDEPRDATRHDVGKPTPNRLI